VTRSGGASGWISRCARIDCVARQEHVVGRSSTCSRAHVAETWCEGLSAACREICVLCDARIEGVSKKIRGKQRAWLLQAVIFFALVYCSSSTLDSPLFLVCAIESRF
jgi:hypothetical protein